MVYNCIDRPPKAGRSMQPYYFAFSIDFFDRSAKAERKSMLASAYQAWSFDYKGRRIRYDEIDKLVGLGLWVLTLSAYLSA